jgi:glucose uptake protein
MMLPTTYLAALLLTVLSMLCWGSWANSMKMAGKWRFELFYFDYAFGVLLAATIAGFTFGSFDNGAVEAGVTAFSFVDGLAIAAKTQMAYAFGGGIVFNLANMLLVAAIARASAWP